MKITTDSLIGIIGGRGKTGSQFARLLRSHGYRVRVTGAATKAKNADLLRTCDVLIFALPLSRAAEIMGTELASATRKDQLVLDLSSLKSRETEAMLAAKGEVIGMHPLFGPGTEPKGERIILCPGRASKETLSSLRSLLKKLGLKTSVMTPEAHDRLMGVVQAVPHLKSLLMADVLRGLRVDLTEALKTCTPTYEMEFNVIARFLDDHPDLYVPIIFRNPATLPVLKKLRSLLDAYVSIAETGNLAAAEERYTACKKLFQPHLRRARAHSEACIKTLLSLTR